TVDGVTAGKPSGTGQRVQSVGLTKLMMMPAARAEILVRNDGARTYDADSFKLVSTAVSNLTGPAVELASVTIERPAMAQAPLPRLSVQKPPVLASTEATPVSSASARTTKAAGHFGHGHDHMAANPMPAMVPAMGGASVDASTVGVGPCFPARPKAGNGLLPGERRQIVFGFDGNNLALGANLVDRKGTVTTQLKVSAFNAANPHVCSPFGTSEVWELVNTTNFPHNFHMHQVKFRLAHPAELKAMGVKTGPIVDPQGTMNGLYLPEDGGGVDVWHDTLPLPPSSQDGTTPGRAFVVINFRAVEQIGTFVYHCHILGHEDNGMMAVMEVIGGPLAKLAQK
ncbi:MAG TPA: multicopper oxidase domain-containing protein, partial [Azospirillum sp.]